MPDVAKPLSQIGGRPQEHGRIKFGVKTATAMKTLKTWRFTSTDREAIEALADLYGGKAKPWHDDKANPQDQFEVITTSDSINVMLPPEALSVWYELWGGKGCLRRCDGETTQALTSDPHEPMVEVPCICNQNERMECKPKTRLKVLLPEIRMAGFWRLETGSWNAMEELSAMERALAVMQQYGILVARLTLHQRSDLDRKGKRRHYIVPRLEFNESTQHLIDGASTAVGLPTGTRLPGTLGLGAPLPAIGAGDAWIDEALDDEVADGNSDDHIIDAEIVEEGGSVDVADPPPPGVPRETDPAAHHARVRARLHATIGQVAKAYDLNVDDFRHGLVKAITSGAKTSSSDLTDHDVSRVIDYLDEVLAGERTVQMQKGEVRMPKKES